MTLPALAPMPAHLVQHGSDPNLLRDELVGLIRRAIEYHPRSQQVALGPSEVGHPCSRLLGYKMLGYDENPRRAQLEGHRRHRPSTRGSRTS